MVQDLMSHPEAFQMICPGCASSAHTAHSWSSGRQTSSSTLVATQEKGLIHVKPVGKDLAGWTTSVAVSEQFTRHAN